MVSSTEHQMVFGEPLQTLACTIDQFGLGKPSGYCHQLLPLLMAISPEGRELGSKAWEKNTDIPSPPRSL